MTNTLFTLHDDTVDDILAVLRNEDSIPDQERRDVLANTLEAQR
jgi:hypothetical protein